MRGPVLHIFFLELRIMFDSALGHINISLEVIEIFLKKSLEIDPE